MYQTKLLGALLCLCLYLPLSAQNQEEPRPLDGIFQAQTLNERLPLADPFVREADVNWQKTTWSVIDSREKVNLPFRYVERPLFTILMEGIEQEAIKAYSSEKTDFSMSISFNEIYKALNSVDTITIVDPETMEPRQQIVRNAFDPTRVIRWRTKEVHYFDTRYSQMKIKTLGIAPIVAELDDNGEIKYERALFWVYLPHCRDWLMKEPVFSAANNKAVHSWDDIFQMRFFSSYTYQEKDIQGRRLKDYLRGRDLLIRSMAIEEDVQNREHDAWSN